MPLSSHAQHPHNVSTILAGLNKNADKMGLTHASASSGTNTNTQSQSHSQPIRQPLQLPTPQLFDILPALHETLARIDHASPNDPLQSGTSDNELEVVHYAVLQPLDPKDLPTAILPLKAQMRKGLREVERLPDMERSVQEQDEEIAELEERIRRQEGVMAGLAGAARGMGMGGKVRRGEAGGG
ncbi:hypothetical protein LTR36_007613 [Oleoguttula mirabilis]|uniref:Mediator of RNA polymerase II transcription subunit 9 n=1 Tax=Oleoguttula mirabilis TaxID=1507867 RepID=A0AAV9JU95_9PEZI|nr:hypothetical protein LTR36_007613 [Oleoguttula mirabilis]